MQWPPDEVCHRILAMGLLLDGVDSFCNAVSHAVAGAADPGAVAVDVRTAIAAADDCLDRSAGMERPHDRIYQPIDVFQPIDAAVGDLGAAADLVRYILTDLHVAAMPWNWMRAEEAASSCAANLFALIDHADQILPALDGDAVHGMPSGWRDEWQAIAPAVAARGFADRAVSRGLGPRSFSGIVECCRLLSARFPRPGLLGLASLVADLSSVMACEGPLVVRQRLRELLQPGDLVEERSHRFGLEEVRALAREVECGMVELPQHIRTMVRLHAEMPSSGSLDAPDPHFRRGASATVFRAQMAAFAVQVRDRAAAGWMPPVATPRAVPAARPMESHRRHLREQGRQFWGRIRQVAAGMLELHLAVIALQTVFASPVQPAPEEPAPPAGAEPGAS